MPLAIHFIAISVISPIKQSHFLYKAKLQYYYI